MCCVDRLSWQVFQEDVPEGFFMPLPVLARFDGGGIARMTVFANGPESSVEFRLRQRPRELELDPEMWILSSDTDTDRR